MERLVDDKWVEVEPEKDSNWDTIEGMFREVDEGLGNAAGPVAASVDAGRDLAVPERGSDMGPVPLVQVDAGPGLGGQPEPNGSGVTAKEQDELIDEIPGLTVSDGKTGVRGSRNVLQRLRQGAKKSNTPPKTTDSSVGSKKSDRPGEEAVRLPKRVEVAESAAQARGPAVRDTTSRRQEQRGRKDRHAVGTVAEVGRIVSKPAPGILSDQPKWVKELFEAHFRSSRTGELRRKPSGPDREVDGVITTPNRMKMSREDFAIGWLVMLEAARRNPEIVRARNVNGAAIEIQSGGTPVLPAGSNTD